MLAIETKGANSLEESVKVGRLVTLSGITSIAKSLGAQTVSEQALKYALSPNVVTGTVTDADATDACIKFARDHNFIVEPACGAALAAVYNPTLLQSLVSSLPSMKNICVMVCGGNMTGNVRNPSTSKCSK